MSAADAAAHAALALGLAAGALVFFVLLSVAMLPLGGWSAESPRRSDVEPGVL